MIIPPLGCLRIPIRIYSFGDRSHRCHNTKEMMKAGGDQGIRAAKRQMPIQLICR